MSVCYERFYYFLKCLSSVDGITKQSEMIYLSHDHQIDSFHRKNNYFILRIYSCKYVI